MACVSQSRRFNRSRNHSPPEGRYPMIKSLCILAAFVATTCFLSPACHTAPKSGEDRAELIQKADAVVAKVHAQNGDLARFCRVSVGYAVFQSVGKGAAGVGGAYGKGVLY